MDVEGLNSIAAALAIGLGAIGPGIGIGILAGKAMEAIAGNWGLSDLLNRMEAVHQATLAVRRNANTALSLEAMMLSWGEG